MSLGNPIPLVPRMHLQPIKLEGNPPIKNYCVLKNSRHVLCEDSSAHVRMIDLMTLADTPPKEGKTMKEISDGLNEKIVGDRLPESWCKLDIRLGSLSVALNETDWLKCRALVESTHVNDPPVINYGEHLMKSALRKVLEEKYKHDIKRLTACESFSYAKNMQQELESFRSFNIAEPSQKYTFVITSDGKSRTQPIGEAMEMFKDFLPKWVTCHIYKSPFQSDDSKIKFTVEPLKLTDGKEVSVIKQSELKSYTITCVSDTLIKEISDLTKQELQKVNSRIADVVLGIDGKVLHPQTPLGLVVGRRKVSEHEKLLFQYRIKLS